MIFGMNKYLLELLEKCIPCIQSEYNTTDDEYREDDLLSLLQSVKSIIKQSKQAGVLDETI